MVDISGHIADIRAAITCALAQPDVDPERLVLWGTSLGGGHVVTVAAEDGRVTALVAPAQNGRPVCRDTLSVTVLGIGADTSVATGFAAKVAPVPRKRSLSSQFCNYPP
ncbi:hypothetical protein [Nocardia abscessus]|uniref:hypothetical protein n=1 Tax=Nocardia abscessus TaxID=120957 RepID=UPI002453A3BA|nr:hypothetical protein [Nocardia abscessus]